MMRRALPCGYEIRALQGGVESSQICLSILESLPDWFGIPEAAAQYAQDCRELDTYVCYSNGTAVGFMAMKRHNEFTVEVHVMGIRTEYHRLGIGRALIACAEQFARTAGCEFIMVLTLDAANPDIYYARTRAFYRAVGFKPLARFKKIWDEYSPCLIMIKPVGT